jgi:GT2 family glycosyltransferase
VRLSVVIVNWNTTGLLTDCVRSIERHPPSCEREVIVVDNASRDFDEAAFRASFPRVTLIVNRDNAGYARGNNQGIAASSGDYVLLLNPDTEVTDGALDALVRFMDEHRDAAAAGARLVRPDGTVERSVRGFPYPWAVACECLGLFRLAPKTPSCTRYRMRGFSYTEEAEVDQPMGSCLILSRRAIDDVGLLDEAFPIFFNEVDWLYRARQKGYRVYFTPSATIIHHRGAGTSQAGRRKMLRESHESLMRFYSKHFRRAMPAPVYWAVILAIRLGLLVRR